MSLDDAIRAARRILNVDLLPARLGDGSGNVYDLTRPGNYYVRKIGSNGELSQRISLPLYPNANIPVREGTAVLIGYDENGKQCIYRANTSGLLSANVNPLSLNPLDPAVYGKINTTSLPMFFCQRHGDTVNFPTTVVVFEGFLELDGVLSYFPRGTIDLASLIPAADLHCFAVVFIRTDLTLEAFASTATNLQNPLTVDDLNEAIALRTAGSLIDWAWELSDAASILPSDPAKNIDLRQWMNTAATIGSADDSGLYIAMGAG